jgi:hypothetical protein
LKKYEDAVILFYDSEFGTPQKYFETFDIDMKKVLHTPLTDVEEAPLGLRPVADVSPDISTR